MVDREASSMKHLTLTLLLFICAAAAFTNYSIPLAQKTVVDNDLVRQLLLEVFQSPYGRDCGMVVSTDEHEFSDPVQKVMLRQGEFYLPLITLKKTEFTHSYRDYTWLKNEEELMDLRTMPPEFQSKVWPGGTFCNFHLILVSSPSKFKKLLVNIIASVRVRHYEDKFLIHFRSGQESVETAVISPPGSSMTLQMATHMSADNRKLEMMTLCAYCKPGAQHGVTRLGHFDPTRRYYFDEIYKTVKSYNLNGATLRLVFYEEMDIEGARIRRSQRGDMYLTVFERALVVIEDLLQCRFDFYVKNLESADIEFRHPNGSWDGMIGEILNNKADVIALMGYTPEIVKAVFVIPAMIFTQKRFITRIPRGTISWTVIVRPYDSLFWLTLLAAMFLSASVIFCIGKKHKVTFTFSVNYIMRYLIEQPVLPPKISVIRVFTLCFAFFSIVVVCGYKAKLVSYLTWPPREPLPETFQELLNSTFKWGMSMLEFVLIRICAKLSGIKYLIKIMETPRLHTSRAECVHKTLTEDFACIGVDLLLIRELYHFVDDEGNFIVKFAPETVLQSPFSPAIFKGAPLIMQVQRWAGYVNSGGFVAKFLRDEFVTNFIVSLNEIRKQTNHDVNPDLILTMPKLKGMFQIWLTGIAISSVFFIAEKYFSRCRGKIGSSNAK